jgi:hypothetical protein
MHLFYASVHAFTAVIVPDCGLLDREYKYLGTASTLRIVV